MSAHTKKTAATKAPKPKATTKAAKLPAEKAQAAVPAKRTPAAVPAKTEAAKAPKPKASATRKTSMEAMLARVEAVRLEQRAGGNFDCFARAASGYCDQGGCAFHAECLSVSRLLHSL